MDARLPRGTARRCDPSRTRRARTWFVVALLAAAPPASAETPAETAKAHADAGGRLFDVQQYDKAAAEFEQAYLLDAQPMYLYALAQAQRLAGDCTKAVRSYQNLLRAQPGEKLEGLANANIERCKQELEQHPPTSAEPAQNAAQPPASPAPALTVTQSTPSPWYADGTGHALVGSGVAVAATGLIVYLVGEKTIKDHNAAPTYDEFQAGDVDTAHLQQQLGVAALIVGGGLIIGGIVHYVLHARTPEQQTVAASISARHATLAFGWSF